MAVSGLGVVLCRLAAVFLFIRGIEHLGFALSLLSSPATDSWQASFTSIMAVVFPVVAAVVVWRLAPKISALEDKNSEPTPGNAVGEKELIAIGTFLVGLYAFLFGLVSAVSVEVGLWAQEVLNRSSQFPAEPDWIQSLQSRAPYVLQILLGIGLMLGRRGIATVFSRVRYAGTGAS